MSKRNSKQVFSVFSEKRAVSEAISQGIIFLLVITSATGVAVASQDIVETTQDKQSLDQAVSGFERLDNIVQTYATAGDRDQNFTATRQTFLYSRNADLFNTESTEITLDLPSTVPYTYTSHPVQVQHDMHEVTYDAGIIQSTKVERTIIHRTPAEQFPENQNMLRLHTMWIDSEDGFAGGQQQRVGIRENASTVAHTADSGAEITIVTSQEAGWVAYLESQEYLDVDDPTPIAGSSQVEINARFTDEAIVYLQDVQLVPLDRFTNT